MSRATQVTVRTDQIKPITLGQVCRDLEELCAAGFLEAFRDEYNIVRYQPVQQIGKEHCGKSSSSCQ